MSSEPCQLRSRSIEPPCARIRFSLPRVAGEIVAFAEVDLPRAEVKAVYVHPRHLRRGLGTALLAQVRRTFRLRTDTDTASAPNQAIGEPIVYPCQTTVALEIDPDGDFVPVLRRGTTLYLLGRRPAP
jgi:GNAT superfamily N-acetyltransferase